MKVAPPPGVGPTVVLEGDLLGDGEAEPGPAAPVPDP